MRSFGSKWQPQHFADDCHFYHVSPDDDLSAVIYVDARDVRFARQWQSLEVIPSIPTVHGNLDVIKICHDFLFLDIGKLAPKIMGCKCLFRSTGNIEYASAVVHKSVEEIFCCFSLGD